VRSATSDESLFPPRCCSRPIGYNLFNALIPLDVWKLFERASQEFSVIAKDRLYCPSPTCSKFLGSVKVLPRTTACPTCHASVCTHCKKRAHPFQIFCKQEDETGALQGLLERNKWQRCPNCRAVVELNQGCYHITCRCRSQFCYLCSATWKTCRCRQWDERMLLVEAERRIDAEIRLNIVRPQPAAPAAVPVTAAPRPQLANPSADPWVNPWANLNAQPATSNRVNDNRTTNDRATNNRATNNRATTVSNEPKRVVGSSLVQNVAPGPSVSDSIGQRAGNSSHHESFGERGSSPFGRGGYGYHSPSSTRPSQSRRWAAEQGSSQGYQSRRNTLERPTDDLRQKRVKEMMERLRTDHDCNPHVWQKRGGAGECSECHHHLPLYLLVSNSISR
jgi:hypothetical protein